MGNLVKAKSASQQLSSRQQFYSAVEYSEHIDLDTASLKSLVKQANIKKTKMPSDNIAFGFVATCMVFAFVLSSWFLVPAVVIWLALEERSQNQRQTSLEKRMSPKQIMAAFLLNDFYTDKYTVKSKVVDNKVEVSLLKKSYVSNWKNNPLIDQFSFFYRLHTGQRQNALNDHGGFETKVLAHKTFLVEEDTEALQWATEQSEKAKEMAIQTREEMVKELQGAYEAEQLNQTIKRLTD